MSFRFSAASQGKPCGFNSKWENFPKIGALPINMEPDRGVLVWTFFLLKGPRVRFHVNWFLIATAPKTAHSQQEEPCPRAVRDQTGPRASCTALKLQSILRNFTAGVIACVAFFEERVARWLLRKMLEILGPLSVIPYELMPFESTPKSMFTHVSCGMCQNGGREV